MSDSEPLSEISNADVSEGAITNEVFRSQLAPSISSSILPTYKNSHSSEAMKNTSHKHTRSTRSKEQFQASANPDKASYSFLKSSSRESALKKGPSVSIIAQNIKNIRNISKAVVQKKTNPRKAPTETRPPDIEARFYEYQRQANEKIEKQRKEQEESLEKECTFKPRLHKSFDEAKRTPSQYYGDVMKYEINKQRKLDQLRELQKEAAHEDFTFQPSICQQSSKILKKKAKSTDNCYERLYYNREQVAALANENSSTSKQTSPQVSFSPRINRTYENRDKPVSHILYEDAVRRMSKPKIEQLPAWKFYSNNSTKILIRAFLKEFDQHSSAIDVDRLDKLNYSRFIQLLKALRLLNDKPSNEERIMVIEIWEKIGGKSGYVRINELKVLLMGILGYYQPWMEDPYCPFRLTQQEVGRVHEKYDKLFKNRAIFGGKEKYSHHIKPGKAHIEGKAKMRNLPRDKDRKDACKRSLQSQEAKSTGTSLAFTFSVNKLKTKKSEDFAFTDRSPDLRESLDINDDDFEDLLLNSLRRKQLFRTVANTNISGKTLYTSEYPPKNTKSGTNLY